MSGEAAGHNSVDARWEPDMMRPNVYRLIADCIYDGPRCRGHHRRKISKRRGFRSVLDVKLAHAPPFEGIN